MYKYLYTHRPPCIGCQPDNWVERDGGLPQKEYDTPRGKWPGFGTVTYKERLPLEQVWKYDLLPLDEFENALYFFYIDSERDMPNAFGSIGYYLLNDFDNDDDDYNKLRAKYAKIIMSKLLG